MIRGAKIGWCGLLLLWLCCLAPLTAVAEGDTASCADLAVLLARQEEKTSREFKQIKRDIAALSQQLEEPGLREILGGIGYILGIFGVAAYVASRRQSGGKG